MTTPSHHPHSSTRSGANGSTPLIQLNAVTKVFLTDEVETHALSGIHLDIRDGEYVSIAGPSGCGKSTLLSILHSLGRDPAVFHHSSIEQVDGPIGVLREPLVVCDHANGRATGVQLLQQIHYRLAVSRI